MATRKKSASTGLPMPVVAIPPPRAKAPEPTPSTAPPPKYGILTLEQAQALRKMPIQQCIMFWDGLEAAGRKEGPDKLRAVIRSLVLADLFYLLARVCGRKDMLHPWVYARVREVEASPDDHLDLWSRGHFKDLADDTPILTASRGWITHGELQAGDQVFSPEGKPVWVAAVTVGYTTSECYRITFNDGASIVAGAGHQWRLRRKIKRRISGTDQRIVSFEDYFATTAQMVETGGRLDVGECEPLQFSVKQLPIDPYVFGAWLGDGTSSNGAITCAYSDIEVIERIRAKGVTADERKSTNANSGLFVLNKGVNHHKGTGMTGLLRRMEVLNNKHIPADYMHASVYQRMELLRGLMDTDGTCDTRGTATFCNANEALARQVFDLAASLSLQPHIRTHSFPSNAKRAVDGRYNFWQVSFQAHTDRNPFALKRKADRAIPPTYYRGCRTVKTIERIPSVPTRCIQVEGGMYVAGRELIPTHNSSTITFGLTIHDILEDPEVTFGIFSHTRPIAKAFLRQIMRELESNVILHNAFPDVLWGKDTRAAPKWSEDDGIIVKRKSNPPEATVEAWGLVDGQPTSKHFKKLLYDDVVVEGSVTTPEMIEKTTKALEQSYNLTNEKFSRRFAGTRWHFNDSYRAVMDRGTAKVRKHPCTYDGTEHGTPVFWNQQMLSDKRRDMGPHTFSAQCLLDPKADALQGFKRDWLRYYKKIDARQMNTYILVDAASEKKKGSDYTAMWVVGLNTDGNYYALDMVRDRMNLTERSARLFELHRKYRSGSHLQGVRYERYGLMADIEHIKAQQEVLNYRFDVTEVAGQTPKRDRIGRLIPLFETGKFYLPQTLHKTDYQKVPKDLVYAFVEEEYCAFPVGLHDDMLDSLSRIAEPDLRLVWPEAAPVKRDHRSFNEMGAMAWMG